MKFSLLVGILSLGTIGTAAAAVATPNFEVKLSLLPSALSSGSPSSALSSALSLGSSSKQRSYEYFDTDAKDLNAAGWTVRLRHKSGKDLELTYKKRYPVTAGISATLEQARNEGFDSSDTNYAAQVDWSYAKQVLSFSNDKKSSTGLSGTSLPSEGDARTLLLGKIPGKLENWQQKNWGKDTLQRARQYGPVTSKVWDGTWNGVDVSVEVVPVRSASGSGTDLYTEFSLKVADEQTAASLRDKAISQLAAWLDKDGDLKTNLILDRY